MKTAEMVNDMPAIPKCLNRRAIFLLVSLTVSALGILVSPAIPLVFGLLLLYLLWSEAGGMSYGNPYKQKFIGEGRHPISKAGHSPIEATETGGEASDRAYTSMALVGFGLILYATALILLFFL
jgi:hypothetical protein